MTASFAENPAGCHGVFYPGPESKGTCPGGREIKKQGPERLPVPALFSICLAAFGWAAVPRCPTPGGAAAPPCRSQWTLQDTGSDHWLASVLPPSARARTCSVVPVVRPVNAMVRAWVENLTVVQFVPSGLVCTS